MYLKDCDPKVGWWCCFCCVRELEEILDENRLASIKDECSWLNWEFWPTKKEALIELLAIEKRPPLSKLNDVKMIEQMLAECDSP